MTVSVSQCVAASICLDLLSEERVGVSGEWDD